MYSLRQKQILWEPRESFLKSLANAQVQWHASLICQSATAPSSGIVTGLIIHIFFRVSDAPWSYARRLHGELEGGHFRQKE